MHFAHGDRVAEHRHHHHHHRKLQDTQFEFQVNKE